MRLRQLTELTRPARMSDAESILYFHGFEKLGSGSYGTVFGRDDKPFVLKLFEARDRAYLEYLDLVLAVANPHFPVLRGRPMQVTTEYWAVKLERLESVEGLNVALANRAKQYVLAFMDIHRDETTEHEMYHHAKKVGLEDNIYSRRSNYSRATFYRQSLVPFEQHYPELAEALRLITVRVLIPNDAYPDMHESNFMQRGTTLVITDPVAHIHIDEPMRFSPNQRSPQRELPIGPKLGFQPNHNELSKRLPDEMYRYDPSEQPRLPGTDISD